MVNDNSDIKNDPETNKVLTTSATPEPKEFKEIDDLLTQAQDLYQKYITDIKADLNNKTSLKEAIKVLEKAENLLPEPKTKNPKSLEVYHTFFSYYDELEDIPNVIKYAKLCYDIEGSNDFRPRYAYRMTKYFLTQENFKEALEWFNKAEASEGLVWFTDGELKQIKSLREPHP